MVQNPRIKPEIVFTLSSPTRSCVVLARPLKFAAASTAVPESVGLAERTVFPVPVDVVTPVPPEATASGVINVSTPADENDDVAEPPKYAVSCTESRVEDA